MSLAHALLASLVQQPTTGYELVKDFNDRIACYWQASQQQIYRELSRLETQGWVESERVIQTDRPNKKVYHLTPEGLRVLREWVAEPSDATAIREELLVKVLAGYLVDPGVIRTEIERRRAYHQARLERYHQMEQSFCQPPAQSSVPMQFMYRTLRRGIRYEQEWVNWCGETLVWLDSLPAQDGTACLPESLLISATGP